MLSLAALLEGDMIIAPWREQYEGEPLEVPGPLGEGYLLWW